jgi:hypothetical protein
MSPPTAFNPLDKHNLGESVALALNRCHAYPLDEIVSFKGAGIYALYYWGKFAPYAVLSGMNRVEATVPIYVGKAVPKGSRKGVGAQRGEDSGSLYTRLRAHSRSIANTSTLKPAEFSCRYLIVDDTWIGLCESLLIQASTPLWNTMLDGFGRNAQGKNRKDGVSSWHLFHGGRDAAALKRPSAAAFAKLNAEVAAYMDQLNKRKV